MKIIKYFFQSLIIYFLFFIVKIIGLNISRYIFGKIFILFGPLFRSQTIINNNLNKVNNFSLEDKKRISHKMWSNYAMTFVEYIYLHRFKKNNNHISVKGEDILNKIAASNKPVIFVSGHFANFELMSMELTKKKINFASIYRPLNNFFLNPFMEYLRRKYVCKNQIKKGIGGVKSSIQYLKNNFSIALMIDQRVSEGKLLPFFNENALTTTLPFQLAIKFQCEIVPIYICRDEKKFTMEILTPIKIVPSDNLDIDKKEITLKLNKIIESMIVKDPSQWILTHNRWK